MPCQRGVIHVTSHIGPKTGRDIERLKAITEDTFELVIEITKDHRKRGQWRIGLVRKVPITNAFFGETL